MDLVTEKVLVLPRDAVPGGTAFTGVRSLPAGGVDSLREAVTRAGTWLDRDRAEQDDAHKQLIPYVVVRDRSSANEQVFFMERTDAGADPRLHRRATIGVGGHINPVDGGADPLDAGLRREWAEELVADWETTFVLIGLLNDDRNPVGSVHLGLVFEVEADGRPVAVREADKLSGRFASVADVHAAWERLETWSQLVVAAIWGPPAP